MDAFPIIKSNRIILEKPAQKFLTDLLEIYSDKETMSKLGLPTINKNQVNDLIKEKLDKYEDSNEIYFVIRHRKDNNIIGFITLYYSNEIWQIEFAINKKHRMNGFGTEAISNVLKFLKNNGVKEVYAHTKASNKPSINVLLKNKFTNTNKKVLFNTNHGKEIGIVLKYNL